MKKADIAPGVVYAYSTRRDGLWPEPIVLLAAPADGVLYSERYSPGDNESVYIKALPGAHAGSDYLHKTTGYPAVMFASHHDEDPARLLQVTLGTFEAATNAWTRDGLHLMVIAHLAAIVGPWEEVVASQEAARQAEQERTDRQAQHDRENRARASAVIAALSRAGIKAGGVSQYGAVTSIPLPLDEAEKLVALLASLRTDQED
jgi:hypothetical protein